MVINLLTGFIVIPLNIAFENEIEFYISTAYIIIIAISIIYLIIINNTCYYEKGII